MSKTNAVERETALFINGVFDSVLQEIVAAQMTNSTRECFLQPYSAMNIRLLADSPPSATDTVRLYISTSDALSTVSYRARITGWEDKRSIAPARRRLLDSQIAQYQPNERHVYAQANGKDCINLITVIDLEPILPFPVSFLTKMSDGSALQPRTRSGNWVPVYRGPDWIGRVPSGGTSDRLDQEFRSGVSRSLKDSSSERRRRLKKASRIPDRFQVVSMAFRRNPDVAAEVLIRAAGHCERCGSAAPFTRTSDSTPYLEVHHRVFLSAGGEDAVENAIALCPNCHRDMHYGPGLSDS
jgi:5-methylcytosine-specific restriction protein A